MSIFISSCLFFVGASFVVFNSSKKNFDNLIRQPSGDSRDPQFTISGPGLTKIFSRSELMKSKALRSITVKNDPAYGNKQMTYIAIPLSEIFEGVSLDAFPTMSFKCLDGFSGAISMTRILNQDSHGSVAYLAIEAEAKKWPTLKLGKTETAGPFYLIWDNPEKSKIMTEEWPYQLAGFELNNQSLDTLFPHAVPAESISANDSIRRGHSLFMTNCFVCHAFNGDGIGKIGPDLNIPYSPTEYFQFKHFSTLVRDPQNLRKWDQARMPGFSSSALSDDDLKSIWSYFAHMSTKKFRQ